MPVARSLIRVGASFTLDPVLAPLRLLVDELELAGAVKAVPYGQLFHDLLSTKPDPGSANDLHVLLLRADDFLSGKQGVLEAAEPLTEAIRSAVNLRAGCWLLLLTPGASEAGPSARFEAVLREALAEHPAVSFVSAVGSQTSLAATYSVDKVADPVSLRHGHIPYSDEYFAALACQIARARFAQVSPPRKVVVLDCDGTLWSGLIGEDGVSGVELSAPYLELQECMASLAKGGTLLCLCSKNNQADVFEVFEQRSEMSLEREHLLTWRINWREKVANLLELSDELDLALGSFVFIDDSPVECAKVRAQLPEVAVLELPAQPSRIPRFLEHCWVLDQRQATEEDRKRADSYRGNVHRKRLAGSVLDFRQFLEQLQLEVEVRPLLPEDLPRTAQMTQRITQFNTTTIHLSQRQITESLERGGNGWVLSARDRFGDYGIVGLALGEARDQALVVSSLLLSCRALGRGIEHRFVSSLAKCALGIGLETVRFDCRRSQRNEPVIQFLNELHDTLGSLERPASHLPAVAAFGDERTYEFSAVELCRAKPASPSMGLEQPRSAPEQPVLASEHKTNQHKTNQSSQLSSEAPALSPLVLGELLSARQLLSKLEKVVSQRREMSVAYVEPRSPAEEVVAKCWARVLGLDKVGVHDRFNELGGSSLQLVRAHSLLETELGREVELTDLFDRATVADAAVAIEQTEAGPHEPGTRKLQILERAASQRSALAERARRAQAGDLGQRPPKRQRDVG